MKRAGWAGSRETLPFPPRLSWLILWTEVLAIGAFVVAFPLSMMVDDTYFYLVVAENINKGLGVTFHGYTDTNGFQPLWQLVVAGLCALVRHHDWLPHVIMAVVVILAAVSCVSFSRLSSGLQFTYGFVGLAIIVPYALFSQVGSESSISLVTAIAGLRYLERYFRLRHRRDWLLSHTFLALMVLSRLDTVFIAALLVTSSIVEEVRRSRSRGIGVFAAALLPYGLLIGPYLLYNLASTGHLMPISGAIKSSTPGFLAPGNRLPRMALAALVPIVASLSALVYCNGDRRRRSLLLPLYGGVFLHGAFVVVVMDGITTWTWYYSTWILAAALATAHLSELLIGTLQASHSPLPVQLRSALHWALPSIALVVPVAYFAYQAPARFSNRHGQSALAIAAPLKAHLPIGTGIFVTDFPGVVAFHAGLRVLPADGLMSNFAYQSEVRRVGIRTYLAEREIQFFMGPGPLLDADRARRYCGRIENAATRFACRRLSDGTWEIERVEVYAPLGRAAVGALTLPRNRVAFEIPALGAAVWRLEGSPLPR